MKKRIVWLVLGLVSLVCVVGMNLGGGKIIKLFSLRLVGAAVEEEINPDALTISDFPGIPGVNQEYVDAFKFFLKAKCGDKQEYTYEQASLAFQEIAKGTTNPELKLRSLYMVTLCDLLSLKIKNAYQSATEVIKLSKELYKDNTDVNFLSKVVAAIQNDEANNSEALKELIESQGEAIGGSKAKEAAEFVGEFSLFQERFKEYEKMKENNSRVMKGVSK